MREFLRGLLAIILCAAIVLGAFALAIAEGRGGVVSASQSSTPALVIPTTNVGGSTPRPSVIVIQPSGTPLPNICPPPLGWVEYTVQSGDTLEGLALLANTTTDQLRQENCLLVDTILPGTLLYLPPVMGSTPATVTTQPPSQATSTVWRTPTYCPRPFGWVNYIVRTGDTLSALSRAYGLTVTELQLANCLDSPNYIYAGQILFVPNIPTRTPISSLTPTPTRTALASATPTPTFTDTATSTETPSATPTETPTLESYP